MRELIVTENITLDGIIDLSAGWFAPAGDTTVDQSDVDDVLRKQSDAADALLLGRVTFEQMRGYWPQQTNDTSGVSDYLNGVSKYVVSSTLNDPEWEHTTVLDGPLTEEVRALKTAAGLDIVITGSMTVVRQLIEAGLVNEYRLFEYPVVIGRGQRLFEDATAVPKLELVESKAFRAGIVLLRYRPC